MSRARPDERPAVWMLRILSRTPPAVYLAVVLPVVVVMAATVLQPWLPPSDLLRDSQVVAAGHAGASPAYGLISNVGIVVAGALERRRGDRVAHPARRSRALAPAARCGPPR